MQLISVADEIAIGKQAQAKVRKETPQVKDRCGAGVRRADRTAAGGARHGGERYPYSFSVADYREINAFALPGGPVWVNRGAIQAAGTESQLAGVLAHEIAHIAQRHAAAAAVQRDGDEPRPRPARARCSATPAAPPRRASRRAMSPAARS